MAAVTELVGDFNITRLRTTDPTFLSGAVVGLVELPPPLVVAVGPQVIGPVAGAVGSSERWVVGVAGAAHPDVVWVCVSAQWSLLRVDASLVARSHLFMIGDIVDIDNTRTPVFGNGTLVASSPGASGGTFSSIDTPADGAAVKSLWIPIDPALTRDGWTTVLDTLMGSTGPGQLDIQLDLSQVVLLGYPINAWGTGALWAPTANRGS